LKTKRFFRAQMGRVSHPFPSAPMIILGARAGRCVCFAARAIIAVQVKQRPVGDLAFFWNLDRLHDVPGRTLPADDVGEHLGNHFLACMQSELLRRARRGTKPQSVRSRCRSRSRRPSNEGEQCVNRPGRHEIRTDASMAGSGGERISRKLAALSAKLR